MGEQVGCAKSQASDMLYHGMICVGGDLIDVLITTLLLWAGAPSTGPCCLELSPGLDFFGQLLLSHEWNYTAYLC